MLDSESVVFLSPKNIYSITQSKLAFKTSSFEKKNTNIILMLYVKQA